MAVAFPMYFKWQKSIPGARLQDDLDAEFHAELEHVDHGLDVQSAVHAQDDGGLGHVFDLLGQLGFQVFEGDLALADVVELVPGDGEVDLLLGDRLAGVRTREQELHHLGVGHGGDDQEEQQQEKHDVVHGRRPDLVVEPGLALNLHWQAVGAGSGTRRTPPRPTQRSGRSWH